MSNGTSRIKQGAEALQWLREYLNSGVSLSGLVLEERNQIRLRTHRMTEGSGEIRYYDHQAEISLMGAEFVRINLDGPDLGIISRAEFEGEERTTLEMSLKGGSFSIEFDAAQVSEQLAPVYVLKTDEK